MNCRKETAATCRVIRSNASQNRRSISIELCPAAVLAVDHIGQGVVVFVRPPGGDATLAGLSAVERAAASSGARWRSRTGNVRSGKLPLCRDASRQNSGRKWKPSGSDSESL